MGFIRQLADRMKEPSSWAGVVGLIAAFGMNIDAGIINYAITIAAAVAGVLSIVLAEKSA